MVVAAVCAGTLAQDLASLDTLLEGQRADADLPALAALVLREGEIVAEGAAGVRAAGHEAEVSAADKWHLGSCGKAMTATMIAALVEEGTLAWGTTLEEALPQLAEDMHPAYRAVTLEQLLTHRAGLGSGPDRWSSWRIAQQREGTPTEQRRAYVAAVLQQDPVNEIGAPLYSNVGYAVAGHLAERATGQSFETLMRVRVFAPLGMESAGFGVPWDGDEPVQPWGHRMNAKGPQPVPPGPHADNPPAIAPAGTMHMTLRDWAAFLGAQLAEPGEGHPLGLSASTLAALHRPRRSDEGRDYALGWIVTERAWADGPDDDEEGTTLTHAGSNTTWYAVVWMAPEREFAAVVVANAMGPRVPQALDAVAARLVARLERP